MSGKTLRNVFFAAAGLAIAVPTGRGGDCGPPAPCGPTYVTKKVVCTEYRPEKYEAMRTVYKTEWKEEKYTAYRCEVTPETHTRQVVINKWVPETKNVERTWWECVASQEERPVTRYVTVQKPQTVMTTRCVAKGGHYECREVACGGCGDGGRRHRLCRRSSCGGCGGCSTQIVNVWVLEYVTEQVPVTVMRCEVQTVTEKVKVTVWNRVQKKDTVPVTTYKCVPETHEQKYVVNVTRNVPYTATRRVAYCVPAQEKFTATRMVPVSVEREVTVCVAGCGCDDCGGRGHGILGRLLGCR